MIHKQYIESGILEAYVTGSASEEEVKELIYMRAKYPEVNIALQLLETDMENIAHQMAVTPPAHTWEKISGRIDEIMLRPLDSPDDFTAKTGDSGYKPFDTGNSGPQYIEVESESSHIRIQKVWKWIFAAVFILGKIFLGCAIYFYLENRQSQQQIKELKTELKQLKR